MILTLDALDTIAGRKVNRPNAGAVIAALEAYPAGLERPHRLAQFLAQVMHESMGFTYDEEIWGPTVAQKRYEGRADLGNTEPGDGYRFRGRGPIQCTGRANYRSFRDWCRKNVSPTAPNFETDPDLLRTDPWEGMSAVWYWTTRNLNALCDQAAEPAGGRVAAITKIVNGGSNGLADRQRYYVRAALHFLDFGVAEIRDFQGVAKLTQDGVAGPRTQEALHQALMAAEPQPDRLAALEAKVAELAARLAAAGL